MKLVSCHIINFGTLSNIDYNFNEKFNEFYKANGEGKSTLCEFILAMFYGLDSPSRTKFTTRAHFAPYNKGTYGGSLKFTDNGKEYVVSRVFNPNSGAKDTYTLQIDGVTNNTIKKLGEEIFGVDKESFMKTIFIKNADITLGSTDSINTKLNNLAIGLDEISFSKAIEKLEDKVKLYAENSKKKSNYYKESASKIEKLDGEISQIEEEYKKIPSLIEEVNQLDKVIADKEIKKSDAFKREDRNNKIGVLNALEAKYITMPSKNELIELSAKLEEKSRLENLDLKGNNETIDKDINDYERLGTILKDLQTSNNPKYLIWVSCSIVLFIIGVVLIFLSLILGLVITGVSLISLIISLVVLKKDKDKKNNLIMATKNEFRPVEMRVKDYFSKYNITSNFVNAHQNLKLNRNPININDNLESINSYINNFKSKHNITNLNIDEIKLDSVKYEYLTKEIESFKGLKEEDIDVDTTKDIEERSKLNLEINKIQEDYNSLEDKEIALKEEKEHLAKIKENHKLYDLTIKFLNTANNNINNKYIKPIQDEFSKYAKLIEESICKDIKMTGNLEIMYEHEGSYHSFEHLSEGEKTICSFCFRLALLNKMYNNKIPFLILDDPFTSLDENHLTKVKDLISKINEQVLYFTCHSSRKLK